MSYVEPFERRLKLSHIILILTWPRIKTFYPLKKNTLMSPLFRLGILSSSLPPQFFSHPYVSSFQTEKQRQRLDDDEEMCFVFSCRCSLTTWYTRRGGRHGAAGLLWTHCIMGSTWTRAGSDHWTDGRCAGRGTTRRRRWPSSQWLILYSVIHGCQRSKWSLTPGYISITRRFRSEIRN